MDDIHRKDKAHDVENPVESPAEVFGEFASQPDEQFLLCLSLQKFLDGSNDLTNHLMTNVNYAMPELNFIVH